MIAIAQEPSTEDTSDSKLVLYVGLTSGALQMAIAQRSITPGFCMAPTRQRAWIPLAVDAGSALTRAHWGAAERGEEGLDPNRDLRVIQVNFTAHGFGHYYLTGQLTTRDWRKWRFHGELPLEVKALPSGELLASVTSVILCAPPRAPTA